MPAPSTLFKGREVTLSACSHDGQFVWPESQGVGAFGSGVPGGGGNYKLNSYAQFTFCTGGANGFISDISPSAIVSPSTPVTQNLVNALRCPTNMRPYLTRLDVCVNGTVPWSATSPTSVPYLSIQDTLGTPLIHIPWAALKGNACLTFPDSDVVAPLILGPTSTTTTFGTSVETFTYSSGVVTVSSALFSGLTSPSQMVGTPVEIIGGTGLGQTAIISAVNGAGTQITLSCNWGAYGTALPNSANAFGTVAPDATSMLAIYWQPLSAYTNSGTSIMTLEVAGGTPYTANVFDNGFNVLVVAGGAQGTVRPIASSTTGGALSLAFQVNSTVLTTTSLICITNEPNMDGSVDMVCDDKLSTAQINTGLQAVWTSAGGTSPVGSNVRIYGEGYWAA